MVQRHTPAVSALVSAIVQAFEEDPACSVAGMAQRFHVSRQTIYNVLDTQVAAWRRRRRTARTPAKPSHFKICARCGTRIRKRGRRIYCRPCSKERTRERNHLGYLHRKSLKGRDHREGPHQGKGGLSTVFRL